MSETVNSAPVAPEVIAPSVEGSESGQVDQQIDSVEGELAQAASSAPKEAKKESLKKKLKIKVDGQEEEVDLDLSNEEELKQHLQMSKAAKKRMHEAAELRKQVEEFVEFVKKNPKGLLKELGLNEREFAEQIMQEAIEEAKKTPEQIERERLQQELEALKQERDREKQEREKAEFNALKEAQAKKLDEDMTSALETGGLPKSPYTIKRMADYMLLAARNNVELDPKDIVPLIRKEMQADLKDFFSTSPDDLVEELISSERIANLRKKQLAKVREQASVQNASQVKETGSSSGAKSEAKKEAKKQTVRDWLYNS